LASEHYKIVTDQYFRSLSHHQANAIFRSVPRLAFTACLNSRIKDQDRQ
ncbi:hypothetical protein T12_3846, partial [Trichinella patagoniensis]